MKNYCGCGWKFKVLPTCSVSSEANKGTTTQKGHYCCNRSHKRALICTGMWKILQSELSSSAGKLLPSCSCSKGATAAVCAVASMSRPTAGCDPEGPAECVCAERLLMSSQHGETTEPCAQTKQADV